jgi:hypothetical protein
MDTYLKQNTNALCHTYDQRFFIVKVHSFQKSFLHWGPAVQYAHTPHYCGVSTSPSSVFVSKGRENVRNSE